jgi:exodeoxyribonuclease VII small subunit
VAKKKPKQQASGRPTLEEALTRLEEIVRLLEDGQLGLSESLARYEEGVGLLRAAYDLLEHAERRIAMLSGVDAEGRPVCQPFDDRATHAGKEGPSPRSRRPSAKKASDAGPDDTPPLDSDIDAPQGLF